MKSHFLPAGWHIGTCTNRTAGITANLLLAVYGATDSTFHGELALFGDLGGGGAFQGTIQNGHISFSTTVPTAQVAIIWKGVLSGNELTGSYVVRCDNPEAEPALRHQEGIWSCKLVRPLGDPSPDDAHRVWVYHNGNEEGPLNAEDFNQRLISGQWPPNAIVGLNDQTTWSTVADCLEKIRADSASQN